MGDRIYNVGSGNVVSRSRIDGDVISNTYGDSIDYDKLTYELKVLLDEYKKDYSEDNFGIREIEKAIQHSEKREKSGLKNAVMNFSGYMKKLAEQLSLKLLVEYITKLL